MSRSFLVSARVDWGYVRVVRNAVVLAYLAVMAAFLNAQSAQAQVSVVDDLGARITLAQPAKRVISLAPHITEMLFAVGAGKAVVGVVDYSDFPPEAKRIVNVGSSARLDVERIVSLRPDLIVVWPGGTPIATLDKLRQLGFVLFSSEPRHLEQVASDMERLAELVGTGQEGARAAASFRNSMAALAAQYSQRPIITLFYQIWDRPITTVAGEQLLNEVFTLCGGRNAFGQIKNVAPQLDVEAVLAANPQVIATAGAPEHSAAWIKDWRRWTQLQAVQNGNVVAVDADLTQRQGPRLAQGAAQLCETLERARQTSSAKPKAPKARD